MHDAMPRTYSLLEKIGFCFFTILALPGAILCGLIILWRQHWWFRKALTIFSCLLLAYYLFRPALTSVEMPIYTP